MEKWNFCFKPVIDEDSILLILGTFPSVKSRENAFYYGHPQNRFWKVVVSEYFNKDVYSLSKENKIAFLKENKIALYDVYKKSCISGSLDNDLNKKTAKLSDITSVLSKYKNIKHIICAGKKAFSVFIKNYPQYKDIVICCPSTSPVNTVHFDKQVWFNAFDKIFKSE